MKRTENQEPSVGRPWAYVGGLGRPYAYLGEGLGKEWGLTYLDKMEGRPVCLKCVE